MVRSILLTSLACLIILFTFSIASAEEKTDIKAHKLSVFLNPNEKTIQASDQITLSSASQDEFVFTLNKKLVITSLTSGDSDVKFTSEPYKGPETGETGITSNFQSVKAILPKGATSFKVAYFGEIYDPIEPSKALAHVRGDYTSGIISPEGVYLSSETGWYPDTAGAVATYNIEVNVPKEWHAVTQGDLKGQSTTEDRRVSSWGSNTPFDGFVLVANKYFVKTRKIEGVDCSTYFYEDNPELSDTFLNKLEEYLPVYQKLFGPYPYSRFDVVENFFSTGYGMAGYTLLGNAVVRMPFATLEGSLAHELVHCWWGNYVFPDWETGNWCEGLTYYSTNYYWNIVKGLNEKADDFRYTDMLKYTLQVSPEEDYSVREFRTKFTDEDGDIGYGKSGAIFRMLNEMLGEKVFFDSLKLVVQKHGGSKATWDDFEKAFEETSGKDLSKYFSTWLDNKGTPDFRMDSVDETKEADGYIYDIKISQKGPEFYIPLQVVVNAPGGNATVGLKMDGESANVKVKIASKATSISLDPNYTIFRRLDRDEVTPCLDATLEAKSLLVVLPSGGDADMVEMPTRGGPGAPTKAVSVKQMFEDIAKSITDSGVKCKIKYDNEVTDSDITTSSILCLGPVKYNSLTSRLANESGGLFEVTENCFTVNGTEYDGENASVLMTVRNPNNKNFDATFYLGNSPQAMFKASYIFFYRSYSYVIFDSGNATSREKWPRINTHIYPVRN